MFDVGDRVVCVDDQPIEVRVNGQIQAIYPVELKRGQLYTVLDCYPEGHQQPFQGGVLACTEDCIGVGHETPYGLDIWEAARFRRVVRMDTGESLAELIDIADSTPRELVDA